MPAGLRVLFPGESGGPRAIRRTSSASDTLSAASRIRRATIAAFDLLWLRAISCGCATWKIATARGGASSPPATHYNHTSEWISDIFESKYAREASGFKALTVASDVGLSASELAGIGMSREEARAEGGVAAAR